MGREQGFNQAVVERLHKEGRKLINLTANW